MASLPFSPVRMRMHSVSSVTKILPSPIDLFVPANTGSSKRLRGRAGRPIMTPHHWRWWFSLTELWHELATHYTRPRGNWDKSCQSTTALFIFQQLMAFIERYELTLFYFKHLRAITESNKCLERGSESAARLQRP